MSNNSKTPHTLEYEGCNFLRQRLILATLSGRTVKIRNIRHLDENPGLRDYEINLLKLLDKLTNGSKIDINATGSSLYYQPGLLKGGALEFDCGLERGVGYYLEVLLSLAPFCEKSLNAALRGVTNCRRDLSVDYVKTAWLPVMKKFLLDSEDLDIKVNKRGLLPDGGGEVQLTVPICRTYLKPVQMLKQGKITKIRGVAYACRVSPTLANRLSESIKKHLRMLTRNVYVYIDARKGPASGNSPGFGATLCAETTEGVHFGAEGVSNPVNSGEPVTPEDLGQSIARKLIEEIYRGGCVDSTVQGLTSLFMVLGQKDVSKFVTGTLSIYSIYYLRHIKDFFQTTFKIESHVIKDAIGCDGSRDLNEEDDLTNQDSPSLLKLGSRNKVLLTCVGVGYTNINKMLL